MSDEPTHRPRAFFGRRKGHPLRRHQAGLLANMLPQVALDLTQPAGDLAALFPHRPSDVRLEIGFGGGEHLVAQARQNPDVGYLGCDGFENAIGKLLAAVEAGGIRNIRPHHGDAIELLAWLPDRTLTRIDLLYPDPWPKRRHWKRRFVQPETLAQFARILKPGGEFRFATDIADYGAWTLAHLAQMPEFVWTAERADDWRLPWAGFVRTRYEAKAIREGRTPNYFIFRKP